MARSEQIQQQIEEKTDGEEEDKTVDEETKEVKVRTKYVCLCLNNTINLLLCDFLGKGIQPSSL